MDGLQTAALVLAAVFVGMWIPVSLQLWSTLRSSKRVLEILGSRAPSTLAQVSDAALELKATLAELRELADSAHELKDSIRVISSIGAAVGPAVVALVRALREPAATDAPGDNGAAHDARETSEARSRF